MSVPALEVRSLSKSFGRLRALSDFSAAFFAGEVHAVLGENGAGKSTVMNLAAGFLTPDSGSILIEGKAIESATPRSMRAAGVALVHQHFMLVPEFTVLENLALDQFSDLRGPVEWEEVREVAQRQAEAVGWAFDFDAKTRSLPVGVQQRIEILKALATDAKVLILDEPTAVLSPDEARDLFDVLRQLKSQGRAIILIAHKLSEVFAIADRVTVLRKGVMTGAAAIGEVDAATLSQWMVGDLAPEQASSRASVGSVCISASNCIVLGDRGELAVAEATFEVRSGEIVGISGVDGNGQLELAEAVAGIRPVSGGTLEVDGVLAYIPQDRRRDGLALDMAIWENLIDPHSRALWIRPRQEVERADQLREQYGIKVESVFDRPRELSGGNQQKVVAARELSREPAVIVAMNPTRGLDINAARFVHQQLRSAADRGAAVLLISTDFDEVAAMADRRLTMSRGTLTASGANL